MHTLLVRKLEIDLSAGFARHWHGGDAFRSHYYNALSMSFPVGEQYFIDSVRAGLALLPQTAEHAPLRDMIQGFIGQEATHRHIHGLYNAQLEQQGLVNHWQHWANWRIRHSRGLHAPQRLVCLVYVLAMFTVDSTLQTVVNLWRDGTLFKPRTWRSAAGFLLGRESVLWRCTGPLLAYLRPGFHPDQDKHSASAQQLAREWIQAHDAQLRTIR